MALKGIRPYSHIHIISFAIHPLEYPYRFIKLLFRAWSIGVVAKRYVFSRSASPSSSGDY